jgi:hypothetical protein
MRGGTEEWAARSDGMLGSDSGTAVCTRTRDSCRCARLCMQRRMGRPLGGCRPYLRGVWSTHRRTGRTILEGEPRTSHTLAAGSDFTGVGWTARRPWILHDASHRRHQARKLRGRAAGRTRHLLSARRRHRAATQHPCTPLDGTRGPRSVHRRRGRAPPTHCLHRSSANSARSALQQIRPTEPGVALMT